MKSAKQLMIEKTIIDNIISGTWPTGHKLPTQIEWTCTPGVTHWALGLAYKSLKIKGWIVSGPRGTYVAKLNRKRYPLKVKDGS